MKIAILSGKGGTGKTFVSVNLSYIQQDAVYLNCDVEVPNGHLYLPIENPVVEPVDMPIPSILHEKCSRCRACMNFCAFHALSFTGKQILLFDHLCHNCGGCALVCPNKAIQEVPYNIGSISSGNFEHVRVYSGSLNPGQMQGSAIIRRMIDQTRHLPNLVMDCSPGNSCHVVQGIVEADLCILVAEPTVFGVNDMRICIDLLNTYNKPFGIVINKSLDTRNYIKTFCREHNIKVLAEIPLSPELARINASGQLAAKDAEYSRIFKKILKNAQALLGPRLESHPDSVQDREVF